jgi:F-type H+-transporting ATPase subunit gamma
MIQLILFTINSSKTKNVLQEKKNVFFLLVYLRSAIAYITSRQKILSGDAIARSKSIQVYDSTDADVLRSFQEFNLASVLYYAMKENATSEQSSRMTAMDNATKNAGELINKLTTYYNRTRQSVITTELIEIISGAAALEEKK